MHTLWYSTSLHCCITSDQWSLTRSALIIQDKSKQSLTPAVLTMHKLSDILAWKDQLFHGWHKGSEYAKKQSGLKQKRFDLTDEYLSSCPDGGRRGGERVSSVAFRLDVSLLLIFCLTLCRSSPLLRLTADAGLGVPSGFRFEITVFFLVLVTGKNV